MNQIYKHISITSTLTPLNMDTHSQLKNGRIPVSIVMFGMDYYQKIGDMMALTKSLASEWICNVNLGYGPRGLLPGYLAIVDHLIRHYYLNASFNENERKALNTFSKNNLFKLYFSIFSLLSENFVNYKEIESILTNASKQFQKEDLSFVYLIYLWMQVKLLASKPLDTVRAITGEPHMHQLLTEHQVELISHMIHEGHALNNWSINSDTLTITDIDLDERKTKALEQLLEQSVYDICLKTKNSVIEYNKIYFEMYEQSSLQFTVKDPNGITRTGVIKNPNEKLTTPLTLDQLNSLPLLLDLISKKGYVRPGLQTLILNNIRFTKEYQLRAMNEDIFYEHNMLYVRTNGNGIEYTVITSSGKKVRDIISCETLKQKDKNFVLPNESASLIKELKPSLSDILEITCKRGHTIAEHETKGYTTFLALLKNQFLIPSMQALHLQHCDLYDDYDLTALYTILAQRPPLKQLNLDHNHITQCGISNLLDALGKKQPIPKISVSFNQIEISSSNSIKFLALKAKLIQKLELTGNMIAANYNPVIKINHKIRVNALFMLFRALSKKDPALTVNSFLTATNFELTKENDDDYLVHITLADLRLITVNLTHREFLEFDNLDAIKDKLNEEKLTFVRPTPKDLFFYLISGITPITIPSQLRDSPLSLITSEVFETEAICKQLLNYHPDAKLKGQLIKHSFFRSKQMERQPSQLFSQAQLTLEKGWVYLIANKYKGILGNEHALLGYEYLTSYGQRIFKVAHLQHDVQKDSIFIEIISMGLPQLIPWTKLGRIIARIQADTKNLKLMDEDIQNDRNQERLPGITFRKLILGSLRNKEIMNCLIYCLSKMNKHLDIPVILDDMDYRPSTVVTNYIKKYPVTVHDDFKTSFGHY